MVSVIVRTKDRPVLLRRALGSVAGQELDAWRLVLVDDGASPATVDDALAEAGLADDPRVHLIREGNPLGRPGALNAGLLAVDTPYWTIHDDDDSWAPGFLAACVADLEANPAAGAVAVRTVVVHEESDGHSVTETSREVLAAEVTQVTLEELFKGNKFPPISLLWRTKATADLGGFADDLTVLEDWEFTLRAAVRHPIDFIDGEPLAFWHQRAESAGADANSVVAEAGTHAAYDAVVRDRFMRAQDGGIGTALTIAGLLEEGRKRDEAARAEQSRVADMWGTAHRDHLDSIVGLIRATSGDLLIEIGRLRGEVIALRNQLDRRGEAAKNRHQRLQQQVQVISEAHERAPGTLRRRMRAAAGRAARRAGLRGGKAKRG